MFIRFPLIAAAVATLVVATGAASAADQPRAMVEKPKPERVILIAPKREKGFGCPDGWVQAAPPLNWQLGCIPNTLTLAE